MGLKRLIKRIAIREDIIQSPPVLIDIGASKEINRPWKLISHFCTCIAFDADDRDFGYSEDKNSPYGKLIKINKIVVDKVENKEQDFFLTNSPHCSSLLEPDVESLKPYHYSKFFEIKQKNKIEVVDLPKVLKDLSISTIDWFKTDAQGIDLRLFKSLDESIQQKIIVLEIEPGFIDGYKNEDKISDCLSFFDGRKEFFLTSFYVKGALRIPRNLFDLLFEKNFAKKIAHNGYKQVPSHAEIEFMNDLKGSNASPREYILAWLFGTLQKHHEVAYMYAYYAKKKFPDEEIFNQLEKYSKAKLKRGLFHFTTIWNLLNLVINKYVA